MKQKSLTLFFYLALERGKWSWQVSVLDAADEQPLSS